MPMDKLMDKYKRLPEELDKDENIYIYRVFKQASASRDWRNGLAVSVLNRELGRDWNESTYRKKCQTYDSMNQSIIKFSDQEIEYQRLEDLKDELYKQQVKTWDAVREKKKTLRDEARIETLIDAIKLCAGKMPTYDLEYNFYPYVVNKEAVLLLSDWHIGAQFNFFCNAYSFEIAQERLSKLLSDVLNYCKTMGVRTLHVLNLGDMIEGNIHVSTRVLSEFDVIQQTMKASELLAEFLKNLSVNICEVNYYSVTDNHGRVNQNKKEHIEKENFGKLIDFYLAERLKDSNVALMFDNLHDSIGMVELYSGKKMAFVHGHLDNINTSFQNLTGGTEQMIHYIAMGHFHSGKMKEFQNCKVYVNGSMKGTDDFAIDHRLFSKPSQTLLIFDEDNDLDFRIKL